MIAQYDGKCGLTGNKIVAGETEIAKYGRVTVLAEYASDEAVNGWFDAQLEKAAEICSETARLLNREFDRSTFPSFVNFAESLERRRNGKFFSLPVESEWVRNEIAGMERRLEQRRNR